MTITFLEFLKNLTSIPSFFIITILISCVMFVNGCSDAPNAIATCVSTRSLTPKKALILVAIFTFLGVFLMTFISSEVAETVFNIADFGNNTHDSMIALCAALIAIVLWSIVTWFFGIPSSQSHSLLAGISGAAIALKGNLSGISFYEWKKVLYGLVLINLLAFIVGLFITKLIEKICKYKDRRRTNEFFKIAQIIGAVLSTFMNGAQDGQKFMGVFLLGVALSSGVSNTTSFSIPVWLMFYCSFLIALGAAIGGIRIIKTVGTKVVKLEKYQGTAADLSSAVSLLVSSFLGIPASSTHSKTCAIMGVGVSKRLSNVNWKVVKNMVFAWIVTFPGCGILGYVSTLIFMKIF